VAGDRGHRAVAVGEFPFRATDPPPQQVDHRGDAEQFFEPTGEHRPRCPRFASLQSYYSLVGGDLDREILPLVHAERLGLLVYSPLAGGFLSGKFSRQGVDASGRQAQGDNPPIDRERGYDVIDVLRAVADRRDTGVPSVALAWVLAQQGVTSVIAGARRPEQLTANIDAVDLALTATDSRN
jgi:aryl-alcohol dehydrogenase-like predicted oxidoreductase